MNILKFIVGRLSLTLFVFAHFCHNRFLCLSPSFSPPLPLFLLVSLSAHPIFHIDHMTPSDSCVVPSLNDITNMHVPCRTPSRAWFIDLTIEPNAPTNAQNEIWRLCDCFVSPRMPNNTAQLCGLVEFSHTCNTFSDRFLCGPSISFSRKHSHTHTPIYHHIDNPLAKNEEKPCCGKSVSRAIINVYYFWQLAHCPWICGQRDKTLDRFELECTAETGAHKRKILI